MALEDILRALEEKALDKIQLIKSEAQERAKEIKAEAEREAAREKRLKLKRISDSLKSEATALIYSATLKGKNRLIKAQEEVVEEAFRIAEERLRDFHSDERYPRVFEALLDECLGVLGDRDVVIRVREDDRALARELLDKRNVSYSFGEPLESLGGVYASSNDGDITVFNTLESRLEKARERLRLDVSKALFS